MGDLQLLERLIFDRLIREGGRRLTVGDEQLDRIRRGLAEASGTADRLGVLNTLLTAGGIAAFYGVLVAVLTTEGTGGTMSVSDLFRFVISVFDPVLQLGDGVLHGEARTANEFGLRAAAAIAIPTKVATATSAARALATGDTSAAGIWEKVDGLADDQVFMVQRFRVVHDEDGTGGWYMVFPGRPFGLHLGQEGEDVPDNAIQLSPGVPFNFGNPGLTTTQQFAALMQLRPIAVFRIAATNASPSTYELDLTPNYIPLRSYWTLYLSDTDANAPDMVLQLFGKKMPYFIPDEPFGF